MKFFNFFLRNRGLNCKSGGKLFFDLTPKLINFAKLMWSNRRVVFFKNLANWYYEPFNGIKLLGYVGINRHRLPPGHGYPVHLHPICNRVSIRILLESVTLSRLKYLQVLNFLWESFNFNLLDFDKCSYRIIRDLFSPFYQFGNDCFETFFVNFRVGYDVRMKRL